jgi:hypothetical protein
MGYRIRWDEIVAAWPLLAPHQPELIAAHLLRPLSDGLEPGRSAATVAPEPNVPRALCRITWNPRSASGLIMPALSIAPRP